jgi:hypothetical protein
LTITAGTLLGGAIAAGFGPDPAYVINAVSFGVSAVLLLQIPRALLQQGRTESHGYWQDLGDGFRLVLHSRPLLAVLLSWNLAMITIAFVNVSEVVLAKESFDAGDFGFGLLFGAGGVGLAIGSFGGGMLAERRPIGGLYGPAIILAGLGYGIAAGAPNVWLAALAVVIAGIGNGASALYNVLLIQRGVPDAYRGRAFTITMSVTYAILGPAMAVAGLVDAVGASLGPGASPASSASPRVRRLRAAPTREPAAAVPSPCPRDCRSLSARSRESPLPH